MVLDLYLDKNAVFLEIVIYLLSDLILNILFANFDILALSLLCGMFVYNDIKSKDFTLLGLRLQPLAYLMCSIMGSRLSTMK